MARLFTWGGELDLPFLAKLLPASSTPIGTTSGTVTTDTGTFRSGVAGIARSTKFDSTGSNVAALLQANFFPTNPNYDFYVRAYVYIPSATGYPSTNATILRIQKDALTTNVFDLILTTTGTLQASTQTSAVATNRGSASAVLSTNTWYRVELRGYQTGSNINAIEVLLNGVQVCSVPGITLANGTDFANNVKFGWVTVPGASKVIYMDDLAVNDVTTGAGQTGYPGDAYVVLHRLAEDGTLLNWVAGAGGTTNLYQAIDNIPPIGVAGASATNASQIVCNNAPTTSAYIAKMEAGITIGAPSSATCKLWYLWTVSGQDSTSVAGGTAQVTANGTSGAVSLQSDSALAAGTYPTNWWRHVDSVVYNPSGVNVWQKPEVTIIKTDATAQKLMLSFVGIVAEYAVPATSLTGPTVYVFSNGTAVSGATFKLWTPSQLPAGGAVTGDALPAGSPAYGPATTGSDGSATLSYVVEGLYWVSIESGGGIYWTTGLYTAASS